MPARVCVVVLPTDMVVGSATPGPHLEYDYTSTYGPGRDVMEYRRVAKFTSDRKHLVVAQKTTPAFTRS